MSAAALQGRAQLAGAPLAQPRRPARGAQQLAAQQGQRQRLQRRRGGAVLASAAESAPAGAALDQQPGAAQQQHEQQQQQFEQQLEQDLEQQRHAGSNGVAAAEAPAASHAAPAATANGSRGARVVVRSMVKHFKTKRGLFKAVNGVDVEMAPGTITALLGPSGSGKTTLLRLIAGLEAPTAGRVFFDDTDITGFDVQDRDLGFVFQGYALFKHMTVAENVTFGPRMRKMGIDLEAKVEELLRLTDLPGLGGRYPPQLSGGQKQRVAVARALACNPRLLLLDEPFGALDPIVRKSLRQGLRDIVREIGVTTVIVTHDQEEAWDIADHVVIFNRGEIEQRGSPEEIARDPASAFVMNFVGDVNHVPAQCQLVRKMGYKTDKPYVMLRPSDLSVHRVFEEAPGAAPATVHDKANIGRAVRYYLRFDDGVDVDWVVPRRLDEELFDMDVGQRVFVEVPTAKMLGFDYSELDASAAVI